MKDEHLKSGFWVPKAAECSEVFGCFCGSWALSRDENAASYLNTEVISVGVFCSRIYYTCVP